MSGTPPTRPPSDRGPVPGDGIRPAETGGGLLGIVRRHRTGMLAGALTVAFLLLAGGSLAAGIAAGSDAQAAPTRSPTASATPTVRPTPGALADPARVRTCSVAAAAGSSGLPELQGEVRDASDGSILLGRDATTAAVPGAAAQVVTAAAALAVLGPDYVIPTDVLDSGSGSGIALVGHGDPTLSRQPAGSTSVYPDAPRLADLATATVQAWVTAHPGVPLTTVTLDATWWGADQAWNPDWPASLPGTGTLGRVTALQVDGDRADPTQLVSPRSGDPVTAAGNAFVAALIAADPSGTIVSPSLTATTSASAVTGTQLAEVRSQPVSALVAQMLATGDATLAESLARITSVEAGGHGTIESVAAITTQALGEFQIPTTGVALHDGSGIDPADRIPPRYLAELLAKVSGGEQNLDAIRSALPAAGQSGSLAARFTGSSARARGHVVGVTGDGDGRVLMAGIATGADQSPLAFAFVASGDAVKASSLDALVSAIVRCGGNLAAS